MSIRYIIKMISFKGEMYKYDLQMKRKNPIILGFRLMERSGFSYAPVKFSDDFRSYAVENKMTMFG